MIPKTHISEQYHSVIERSRDERERATEMSTPKPQTSSLHLHMLKPSRPILLILILLNVVVLLGQLWSEGAPPFARFVNIGFLVLSLVFFVSLVRERR